MKILFASDIAFSFVATFPGKEKVQNLMKNTAKFFESADFSMVNLENIFGNRENGTPILKSGPNLVSDECYVEYLNALKPDVIGLANNHSGDFGIGVLSETIDILKKNGYTPIGAGKDADEAYKPAILEKSGTSVSILAVCENEFGIADDNTAGAAGYNLTRVSKFIFSAKEKGQLPIIYFHGGNEFNPLPSPMKAELYRHFIDLGAKAVIAMHTHCPQGYEYYKGCPIVYSMGNFYFPTKSLNHFASWGYGYMTSFDTDSGKIELIPYTFDFDNHTPLQGDEKEKFLAYIEHISKPISDKKLLSEYFDGWCMLDREVYNYLSHTFITQEMVDQGPQGVRRIKNVFSCEAHNELLTNTMNIIFEDRQEEAKKRVDELKKLQNMEF